MKKKSKKRNLEREIDFLEEWVLLVADYATALAGAVSSIAGTYWCDAFAPRVKALRAKYPEFR